MAIKTYSLKSDGNKYCSAHTKVKEMRCKDGSDKILIDTALMEMIEKLFAKLNCSKYIISSGYRTATHDKAVGGNGKGQHTKGKAVDACFYDKNGKIISSKIVCCVAQDLGFKGIANISSAYKYVHLDMRSTGTYKGDEIKHYNTVTSNFYDYFKVSKDDVAKYTGEAVPKKCVSINAERLTRGSKGNAVKTLQILLVGYGYGSFTPDGSFGELTEKAVKDFQKKNGTDVDGIVGVKTWNKLLGN